MTPRLLLSSVGIAATCAALASTAGAQVLAGDPMLDRSRRPSVPPLAPYKFPKVESKTLTNGINVSVVENHDMPIVAVRVVIDGGNRLDPVGKEGLSDLVMSMLREGTATMTADQLAEAFADLGNSVTPTSFTTIVRNVDRSLELMAGMLMHPAYPQAALDRQRATLVANITRAKDQPASVANRIMSKVLYGSGHQYERTATEASLAGITRDDVSAFHSKYIRPENIRVIVVGDVTPASAVAKLEKSFGKWEKGGSKAPSGTAAAAGVAATTIYLYDRPGSTQSSVVMAQLGPSRSSPDFWALETLNTVYGELSASRLFQSMRETHAYTYGVRTFITWRRAPEASTFVGTSEIASAKTDSALTLWLREMRDIRGPRPPSDSEMVFARTNRVAGLPMRLESVDGVAARVAAMAQDNLSFDFYEQYIARISRLGAGEVAAAAKKYLDAEHLAIVIVGDRKAIEPSLKAANIAPIVVVDENGKAIP